MLLEARETAAGTTANVMLNADVSSVTGNVSLVAADNVLVGSVAAADVTTGGAGEIFIWARSGSIRLAADGDGDLHGVRTSGTGDVLLQAAVDITLDAQVSSGGELGLLAGDDVLQSAAGDALAAGDILVTAGNANTADEDGVVMAAGASTTSTGGNLVVQASGAQGDILLGLVDAGGGQVSLSAGRDILDNNTLAARTL